MRVTLRVLTILILLAITAFVGPACSKKVPPDPYKEQQRKVLMNKGRLVQDLARPANVHASKIEGVALVRGLRGTGADEPPSTYQQLLLQDLQRDVDQKRTAKSQIASLDTAIVLMETIVPPGARKGDRLDVSIKLQPKSEASSIQNGYVEKGELYQYMAADVIRRGYKLGEVNGYVTLDPDLVEKDSPVAYKQGKIIGGAVVSRSRPIWLELKEDERSAGVAQRLEDVINKRFSYTKAGYAGKKKVAEAKAGAARINLEVPEEYRDNVVRYVNVIGAISFYESDDELNERIDKLARQLLQEETSEFAAIQLEAIGSNNAKVVDAIKRGLESPNDAVRFNSAITSSYFNLRAERQLTAKILAEFARNNSKYRPASLATMGVCMKTSFDVDSELRELLSDDNIETRYGAFRALWTRNPNDYMIQGENMGGQFSYHCLNCGGSPYVHIAQSTRPEIALFNADQIFLQGFVDIEANPRLTIRSDEDDIVVKKYALDDGIDEQRRVGYKLDDVVRAIVEIGGTYPDVVSFLTQAKTKKLIRAEGADGEFAECPLAIDALPGAKAGSFKKVRDVEEIAEREKARDQAEREAQKPSMWSKMNPASWFKSDDKSEAGSEDFSLDEFDEANADVKSESSESEEFSLDETESEL
ncbi:MAG: flagellar basal body P-ring protein FlgI [Thermoguttaceae bacterium]|nr:flagellar basal body P-ring protein FlgI [Thermoguttaceae bacterium]